MLIYAQLHTSQDRKRGHFATYLCCCCDRQNKGGNCGAAQIEQATLGRKERALGSAGTPLSSNGMQIKQMQEYFILHYANLEGEELQF
jgi:hypothetical protein